MTREVIMPMSEEMKAHIKEGLLILSPHTFSAASVLIGSALKF